MGIENLVNGLVNEFHGHWPFIVGVSAISGVLGGLIGDYIGQHKVKNRDELGKPPLQFPENVLAEPSRSEVEDDSKKVKEYIPRSIKEATSEGYARINGVVSDFIILSDGGFSGVINDEINSAPFYIDSDRIPDFEERGLIALFFQDSMKSKKPINLDVDIYDSPKLKNILDVDCVRYVLAGQNYEIKLEGD